MNGGNLKTMSERMLFWGEMIFISLCLHIKYWYIFCTFYHSWIKMLYLLTCYVFILLWSAVEYVAMHNPGK